MKNKRLNLIAKQIKNNEKVLDVGTDHGLLPIILLESGITKNITASDLNKEPLNQAKKNLDNKKMIDKVKLLIMDGIKDIKPNDYDVIVIAGMGGNTISKIIKQKKFEGRYLIHSTNNIETIRKTIMEINMKITNEWIIKEGKVYNIIIEAVKGPFDMNSKEIFMGPFLMKNKDSNEYYEYLFNSFEKNAQLSKKTELRKQEREWLKEQIWNEIN